MIKKGFIFFTFFFLVQTIAFCQTEKIRVVFDDFLKDPVFRHASIGFHLIDMNTSEKLLSHQAENSLLTASTLKALTTATALEILGPDYQFSTKIQYDGSITNHTLTGNIFIKGSGDPSLQSRHFKKGYNIFDIWASAIKSKLGIDTVTGNIVGDASLFETVIPGTWPWEDISNYYGTAANALSVHDNLYELYLSSGEAGSPTKLLKTVPDFPDIEFRNHVKGSVENSDNAYIFGDKHSKVRTIRGTIPQNRKTFKIKGALPDPALFASKELKVALQKLGVVIIGRAESLYVKTVPSERAIIYSHFSEPLKKIIQITNEKSVNLNAELLLHQIGLVLKKDATRDSCIQMIKDFWETKGFDTRSLFMYDGSGLSPFNAVSASFLTDLMVYMYNNSEYAEVFFNSLPEAGINGTMKYFGRKSVAHGKIIAKSGSMKGVRAYTGYIDIGKEKPLAFTLMINRFNGKSKDVRTKIAELLEKIYRMK